MLFCFLSCICYFLFLWELIYLMHFVSIAVWFPVSLFCIFSSFFSPSGCTYYSLSPFPGPLSLSTSQRPLRYTVLVPLTFKIYLRFSLSLVTFSFIPFFLITLCSFSQSLVWLRYIIFFTIGAALLLTSVTVIQKMHYFWGPSQSNSDGGGQGLHHLQRHVPPLT